MAQMTRSRVTTKSQQSTSTAVQPKMSQALCKNMTKLCVSSILSARNLLDPACFKKKPFVDGMETDSIDCVEKLPSGSTFTRAGETEAECESIKEGALLQQWIEKGVFEAIEKQYLKSMSLIVARVPDGEDVDKYNDELGNDVVENYTFKYDYSDDGECMLNNGDGEPIVCTKANMLEQSKQLIRNMTMFNDSLPKLPDRRHIVLKLKYHPNTPEDYEPDFFREASADSYSKFASKPKRVVLGDLNTSYHSMSLTFTGANWLFEDDVSDNDFEEDKISDDLKDVAHGGQEGAQLLGAEEFEEDMATQPQSEVVAPAPSPSRSKKSRSKKSQSARVSPRQPTSCEPVEPIEDLERKFGRLNSSSGRLETPKLVPEVPQPLHMNDEQSPQEDINDFDDDDDKTRLDDDEVEEEPGAMGPSQNSKSEVAILNYLAGKKSAGVGIISLITRIDELTVSALLQKMQKKNLVVPMRGDRWKSLVNNDTEDSITDSVASDWTQAKQLPLEPVEVPKRPSSSRHGGALPGNETPHRPRLAMAPPLPPPKAAKEKKPEDKVVPEVRKNKRGLTQKEPDVKSMANDFMPGNMPYADDSNSFKQRATNDFDSCNDSRHDAQDDDEEESDPYGMGGLDLSQCSQSSQGNSQGRSKYSVVKTPIKQARKRSKTTDCR